MNKDLKNQSIIIKKKISPQLLYGYNRDLVDTHKNRNNNKKSNRIIIIKWFINPLSTIIGNIKTFFIAVVLAQKVFVLVS